MNGAGLLFAMVLAVVVGAAVFAYPRLEGEAPTIEEIAGLQLGKTGATIAVEIADPGTGLRAAEVRLVHAGKPDGISLAAKTYRGTLMWGGIPSSRRQRIEVELDPAKLELPDGEATLSIRARDWSWRSGFDGNIAVLDVPITIDTTPPKISLESGLTYVSRGGSGAVVYRVTEPDAQTGVRVGEALFRGYPMDGSPDRRVALFAIPVSAEDSPTAVAFAADAAGNESSARIPVHVLDREFKHGDVTLPQSFLEDVVPRIAGENGIDASDPVAAFRVINDDLRAKNEATIRGVLANSSAEAHWRGAFEQLRNSKVTSHFAEKRSYRIDGAAVSEARHYGFDLASSAAAPVTAANAGVVAYAGDLGIYGNCIIVDHGLGLSSLYAHLSSIDVEVGASVEKGERLGATGSTGLAGGDHLHFAILVGETYVDPLEWWDGRWVKSHVEVRLGEPAS